MLAVVVIFLLEKLRYPSFPQENCDISVISTGKRRCRVFPRENGDIGRGNQHTLILDIFVSNYLTCIDYYYCYSVNPIILFRLFLLTYILIVGVELYSYHCTTIRLIVTILVVALLVSQPATNTTS